MFIIAILVCWITAFYFNLIVQDQYIPALGIVGICGSLFVLGVSYKINKMFSSNLVLNFLRFCGINSILIYVFHLPTFLIIKKIIDYVNFPSSFWGFVIICFSGIFFPLGYGKILSYNASIYKLLLGRNP